MCCYETLLFFNIFNVFRFEFEFIYRIPLKMQRRELSNGTFKFHIELQKPNSLQMKISRMSNYKKFIYFYLKYWIG